MAEPWFDPNTFGALVGGIGGGVGGTLGGLWGALVGTLAPKGRGRTWMIGIGWTFVGVGIVFLAIGVCALVSGQPFGIWYAPTLLGFIFAGATGGLMPVVHKRYAEAEARKVQAEDFRGQ